MRTQPETRARSSQEAGKSLPNLRGFKTNQACSKVKKDKRLLESWAAAGDKVASLASLDRVATSRRQKTQMSCQMP